MSLGRRSVLLGGLSAAVLAACDRARRASAARVPTSAPAAAPTTTPQVATPGAPAPATATTDVAGAPARFVQSGPHRPAVALTFHGSGDVALTKSLLDKAAGSDAPITVFAVGQWLAANPAMAPTIEAGGHELANHTYTHPALKNVSRSSLTSEITRCRDVLDKEIGSPGRWFRPSGTDVPTQAMLDEAGAAGYPVVVGYDIDPLDYQDPGAAVILERVKAALHPGAIVSLHTGHAGTVDAFEPVVAAVRAAGLEPVLLRDLLA